VSSTIIISNTKKSKLVRDWCASGLAVCGWLIALLVLLAVLNPQLGRYYTDPFVSWSSRLLWQPLEP
jgi:hypothetical protein